jgi:hypothetical protein
MVYARVMTHTRSTLVAKFNAILDMEQEVRIATAVQAFRLAGVSDFRAGQQDTAAAAAQGRLYAALDALTPEEAVAFGVFRREAMR